jgi:hypothetical protein
LLETLKQLNQVPVTREEGGNGQSGGAGAGNGDPDWPHPPRSPRRADPNRPGQLTLRAFGR